MPQGSSLFDRVVQLGDRVDRVGHDGAAQPKINSACDDSEAETTSIYQLSQVEGLGGERL